MSLAQQPGEGGRPLAGITVLDLTSVVMGPYATMVLGDLGADVIKIEPPCGDSTRQVGHQREDAMGSVFLTLGRNKRSIVIDLKHESASEILAQLIRRSDVILHNMRPQAANRLGLDYASIAAINPQAVFCEALGFGEGGPYHGRPAYDDMLQGACGIVGLMDRVYGEPVYLPMIVVDKTVGLMLANAVMAAMVFRERTGRGQHVQLPMFEAMASFTLLEHLYDSTFVPPERAAGYPRVTSPKRRPYRTKNGVICALPYLDKHYERLFAEAGRPQLMEDPRFATMASRIEHIGELSSEVEAITIQRSTEDWLLFFCEADIPAMAVSSLDDLLHDPHLEEVGFFEQFVQPGIGPIIQARHPAQFRGCADGALRPAPYLGENTRDILLEAGFGEARIDQLVRQGVVSEHPWSGARHATN